MKCCDCSTREGRSIVRQTIRESWDRGDVWGSALGMHFAIADTLQLTDNGVPTAWQYRPAALLTEDTHYEESSDSGQLLDAYQMGDVSSDDLVYWGNVLSRYADLCKRAGRDY